MRLIFEYFTVFDYLNVLSLVAAQWVVVTKERACRCCRCLWTRVWWHVARRRVSARRRHHVWRQTARRRVTAHLCLRAVWRHSSARWHHTPTRWHVVWTRSCRLLIRWWSHTVRISSRVLSRWRLLASCCLPCHHVLSDILRQSRILHVRRRKIRVSLKKLCGLVERVDKRVQSVAAIGDLLRLAQRFSDCLVLVDSHVQICLEHLLRLANEEESNLLWNSVTHISHHERVVGVDLLSQVTDECVALGRRLDTLRWLILLTWLILLWISRVLLLLVQLLSNFLILLIHLVFLEVKVVGEVIVQLSVDDGFNQSSGVIS